MLFYEKDFVIANICIKDSKNITGLGNIMGIRQKNNKVLDLMSKKEYQLVKNDEKIAQGVYAVVINTPFKDSKKKISTDDFNDSRFKKYYDEAKIIQDAVYNDINGECYGRRPLINCGEDNFEDYEQSYQKVLKKEFREG